MTISRFEQALQCNIEETASIGIDKAKKFYSIEPILSRNLNLPKSILDLFSQNQQDVQEGNLSQKFQLFNDI
jgi:hypothetical protein